MFKELQPLLAKRALVLTATAIKDDLIRLTITPRPTDDKEAKQLSQPFVVEGTAEELDSELPTAIANYSAKHINLADSIALVNAEMDASLKEIKDEAAKKVAEAKKSGKTSSSSPTKKSEPVKDAKPAEPQTPSLFETMTGAAATPVSNNEPEDPKPEPPSPPRVAADEDDSETSEDEEADEAAEANGADPSANPTMSLPGLFPASQDDEESELLKEAYHGNHDEAIAA